MKLTQRDISFKNLIKKERIKSVLTLANQLQIDEDYKEREKQKLCLICFYQSRGMHTNAVVSTECIVCENKMCFGNSDIDKTCLPCADKYLLCKHCGSDIDYKERRKNDRNKDFKFD